MLPAQAGKVSKSNMSLPVVLRVSVTMPTQRMFINSPVNTWGGCQCSEQERMDRTAGQAILCRAKPQRTQAKMKNSVRSLPTMS